MTNAILSLLLTPQFPQALDREFARLDRMVTRAMANAELATCCYDRCHERATVEEIATGLEYCLPHFREVDCG